MLKQIKHDRSERRTITDRPLGGRLDETSGKKHENFFKTLYAIRTKIQIAIWTFERVRY
jgi:hypothetical protein